MADDNTNEPQDIHEDELATMGKGNEEAQE